MKSRNMMAALWEEGGGYVAACPELGVASCGRTPADALSNLKDAVDLYMENARALGFADDLEGALLARRKFASTFEVEG
ncbi:type II toxin-antitoxin system HicB family antitoxin [Methanofollis fontis]|uniref:HicB family protein n=1 Tax=Methanofollis fontis TaxID=2052832 RepID=A0A483CTI2_9EURY|nr:type II toxin-antitoxin system HicB family antitoxin [Methanofollis fontis]TAJ44568.1 HicB family protein [Methanofollis fontis]